MFATQFAQVIGVAGNHDDVRQVSRGQGALLDGDWVTMGPLCVGGTGLIMGHSSKPGRRADAEQLDRIEAVAEARPDILIPVAQKFGKLRVHLQNAPAGVTAQRRDRCMLKRQKVKVCSAFGRPFATRLAIPFPEHAGGYPLPRPAASENQSPAPYDSRDLVLNIGPI